MSKGQYYTYFLTFFSNRHIYTYAQHVIKLFKWTKSKFYTVQPIENIILNILISNLAR